MPHHWHTGHDEFFLGDLCTFISLFDILPQTRRLRTQLRHENLSQEFLVAVLTCFEPFNLLFFSSFGFFFGFEFVFEELDDLIGDYEKDQVVVRDRLFDEYRDDIYDESYLCLLVELEVIPDTSLVLNRPNIDDGVTSVFGIDLRIRSYEEIVYSQGLIIER